MNTEMVAEQALKLNPNARAYIAEILLESLDYEEDVIISPEWQQEIKQRAQEIISNPEMLVNGEKFFVDLKNKYL